MRVSRLRGSTYLVIKGLQGQQYSPRAFSEALKVPYVNFSSYDLVPAG